MTVSLLLRFAVPLILATILLAPVLALLINGATSRTSNRSIPAT